MNIVRAYTKCLAFDAKLTEDLMGVKPALRVENDRIVLRKPVVTNKLKFAAAVVLAVAYDGTCSLLRYRIKQKEAKAHAALLAEYKWLSD